MEDFIRAYTIENGDLLEVTEDVRPIVSQLEKKSERRSEVRAVQANAHSKGTFLIKANVLTNLNPEQKDELFSRLYANRSELRLVVFDEHGKIPNNNPAINAILQLPNTRLTSESSYDVAIKKYGIPKSIGVLFLTPGEVFRRAPDKYLKAVLLKSRIGEIEFARLLAINGGVLPNVHEENGVFDPPNDLLASIGQEQLASLVVAYAA